MDKKIVWGIGIGIMLILAVVGIYYMAGGTLAAANPSAQPGVNPTPSPATACAVAMNTQVTATNYAKPGSAETVTAYVYGNDGAVLQTSLSNNTNFAVSGYYTYTFLVDGSNMFAQKFQHTYACNGNENVQARIPEADTAATISFINTNGVTINSATNNESVATGASVSPTFKLKNGATYKYVTSPYCGKYVLTAQFANVSAWDLSQSTVQGCTEISVPKVERGTAHQAWECSAPDGVTGNFQGDARTIHVALLPTGHVYAAATSDRITFKVYPEDNVPNSITGIPLGCVPENDVGTAAQTAVTSGGVYYMGAG